MEEPVRKGLLLVVSGPAGVGKGTIDQILLQRHENMKLSVSATTRAPRPGEIDGVHYFFITEERFQEMIREDAFLEYMNVFGMNHYGTPRDFVREQTSLGNDIILEIDVNGAMNVRKACPDAVLVFIAPPSMDQLRARLVGRGTETAEAIERRTRTAYDEIARIPDYDYVVVNDDLDTAVEEMEAILRAEHSRTSRNHSTIDTLLGGNKHD